MREAIRLALPFLAVSVLAACDVEVGPTHRAEAAIVSPISSVWAYRVEGAAFDEPFEIEMELRLHDDDRFVLVVDAIADGEPHRAVATGAYRWRGDELHLTEDDGNGQRLRRRGDRLVLETGWTWDVTRAVLGLPELELERAR